MFFEFGLIGTTASGKSALAYEIALNYNCVILSLDSLSIYKKIDIASAKPTKLELENVRHFGINLVEPDENFSAGDFFKEYERAKNFAIEKNIPLIIAGGSGFYLKSLLSGLCTKIKDSKSNLTNDEIFEKILKIDPEFSKKISKNDSYRLKKWLSIFESTNEIPTKFLKENTKEPIIKNLKIFEIFWEKDEINRRIEKRTKQMIKDGLIEEAKFLFSNYDANLKPLKSIGLKESFDFLQNKISLPELENLITIHTRQLAKRQRTFNRSQFDTNLDNFKKTRENIVEFIKNFK